MGPTDCVLCDQACADFQALAEHLQACHQGACCQGGKTMVRSASGKTLRCFCGSWFVTKGMPQGLWMPPEMSPLARHLERHGGLAAHLLKIALRPKKKRINWDDHLASTVQQYIATRQGRTVLAALPRKAKQP